MPVPVEVARLITAIEQFEQRSPRDLPGGVLDSLKGVREQLGGYDTRSSGEQTPGQKEVQKVNKGTDGTGAPYSDPRGPDKPSPGQREAMGVSQEIGTAMSALVEKMKEANRKKGDGEGSETAGAGAPAGSGE